MRPIASFTLHAVLAAVLAAVAATSAAAGNARLTIGGTSAGGGGHFEVESYSWGAAKLQPGGNGGAAQKDIVMKGASIGENAPHGRWIPITERPGLATGDLNDDGSAAAKKPKTTAKMLAPGAGKPTSVRQYGAGRLTIGSLPGCTVGAGYPDALLETAAARYELKEVIVTGCSPEGASLDYVKVVVRGWDPQRKESVVGEAR